MLLSPVMGCWWAGGAHSPGNKDTTISIASPRHPNTHRRIFWLSCEDLSTPFTEMWGGTNGFCQIFIHFACVHFSFLACCLCHQFFCQFACFFWLFLVTSDSWTHIGHILSYGRIVSEYCNLASGPRSSQQLLLFRVSWFRAVHLRQYSPAVSWKPHREYWNWTVVGWYLLY